MGNIVYKPATSKGPVFLSDGGPASKPPTITLADGTVVTGKYLNTVNEGQGANSQYVFPTSVLGQKGAKLSFNGQTQTLDDTNSSYRGGAVGALSPSSKGAIGGEGSDGVPSGDEPGNIGFGSFPAKQNFPGVTLANYSPISSAPYNFTDPTTFAQQYGAASRAEQTKNFNLGSDMALSTLDTELKSLQAFAPAASALKQSLTSADNTFNQARRTQQVNSTLPGATDALNAQAGRAATYATGSLPDAQQDKALELGIRSSAADQAASGGFGASSSAARKDSDLISAADRLQIAQYGESLTSSNITQRANLLLAPTEYSNAGSEINVNPSVSAGQLIPSFTSQANSYAALPVSTALASNTQQNEFTTSQQQATNTFNASNELGLSEFNAGNTNTFALDKFGYNVQYAGAVAGAAQTNTNTGLELQQQQQYQQIAEQLMQQTQETNEIKAGISGITALLGQGSGTSGGSVISQIGGWLSSLFGGSGGGGSSPAFSATDPNSAANAFIGNLNLGGGGIPGLDTSGTTTEQVGSGIGEGVGDFFGGPEGGAVGSQIGAPVADAFSSAYHHIF